jgi:glycosyltransferase involved in cell wall biosynthesis
MRAVLISRVHLLAANRVKWNYIKDAELFFITPPSIHHTLKTYQAELCTDWPHFLVPAWNTDRLSPFFFHPWQLRSILLRLKPDLIQVDEEPLSLALLQVMTLKNQLQCPIVFFSWENLPIKPRLGFSVVRHFNLSRADGAIAGTREAAQQLQKAGFRGQVAVIPQLGVSPEHFRPLRNEALRRELGLRSFTIGYLGRIVPEKGLWVLLKALALLNADWHCLIVGEGSIRKEWLAQAEQMGLGHRVIWIPTVPHADVVRYINAMDVLVLPSLTTQRWKEQFGHVLIQAMSCQVPVIGSNSGAIPEVIGDAGIVVPEGDPSALARAIERLYRSEEERMALGKKGRERVLQHFTNEQIAQRTWLFWQEILDARSPVCR